MTDPKLERELQKEIDAQLELEREKKEQAEIDACPECQHEKLK